MKVLHVISNLDQGGAETSLFRLLASQDRSRFTSFVVSLLEAGVVGGQIRALGVPVDALRIRGLASLPRAISRLHNLTDRFDPDLIQGWMYHGNMAASLTGAIAPRRVPVVWNIRHTPTRLGEEKLSTRLIIRFGRRLSRTPARIIYNARRSSLQHAGLGYDPARSVIIPNGFDVKRFSPSCEAVGSVRQELGLEPGSRLIGLIGNFRPIKDHATFLTAAGLLSRRIEDVHFLLSGIGVEPGNPALARMVQVQQLEGRVHLLGPREDVARLMAALDIMTCCSISEAFPNVVGEAMACGALCVVTDVGDCGWMVGDAGRVVPSRNPVALATAWSEIMQMDQSRRRDLGLAARERVVENFSLARMVENYEQLYSRLAGQTAQMA